MSSLSSDSGDAAIPPYVFTADDDETGLTPAHAAATAIIMRDAATGAPELLMVKRSATMAFAAGMAVFPGGRVDPGDVELGTWLAPSLGIAAADAAARIAAVRETIEETGLAIGLTPHPDAAALAPLRDALLAGEEFVPLLEAAGATLDLTALEPFARWRPTFAHARTFDTRFYLVRLDRDVPALSVVVAEHSDLFWVSAADALARADRGEIDVIFPTRRNLERLACFASHADAVASARRFGAPRITPYLQRHGEVDHLCIRGDCGYPVTSEPMGSAMRG